MSETRNVDGNPLGWFVNTATAPRGCGLAASGAILVGGMVMVWAAAVNPIFGLGLRHPVTIAAGVFVVCVSVGTAAFVWSQPDKAWRRVPDGPLSPEFRALADTGREREAMARLQQEYGAGISEARQVLEKYLAERSRDSGESGAAPGQADR